MSIQQPELDHVVLLLPYADLASPPTWLTDNFTLSPGGAHADGRTENRLVLFADGTYLEVIAFVNDDPTKRKGHWWDKPFGFVDYAFTTAKDFEYDALCQRLEGSGSGVSYDRPHRGGRTRPDGVEMKWDVTFPAGVERGVVPFWCHDVTPRHLRVPLDEASTTHPCGASGMAGVRAEMAEDGVERVGKALEAITGLKGIQGKDERRFEVGVPVGESKPSVRLVSGIGKGDLELSLVVRTDKEGLQDVKEKIFNGTVSILFEK
ncbi:Hypothetical protein R9X50_00142500 [Acrodontium crateriforme]|uniref:Glyoxalase-like domain-containing protein n=1 Tax=Acrodontium crateriforme TaxID=150365 RepID=A0AAQ3RA24_9PEZI|nr:Hypothetical protein R9X50_00142500 [Acrodontium crateriforme]